MVVNDFNIEGIAIFEAKADSPLVVDTNTVGASSVALQFFKSIVWRNSKIIDPRRSMQHQELALCN